MRISRRILRWSRGGAWCGAVFAVLLVYGATQDARAEDGRAAAPGVPSIVVDGADWRDSSSDQRQAFLVGVANLIVAEGAYAKRHEAAMPPVSARIVEAVAKMKLAEVEARITRWYEANPTKMSMPVMGVVWHDIVGQRP